MQLKRPSKTRWACMAIGSFAFCSTSRAPSTQPPALTTTCRGGWQIPA